MRRTKHHLPGDLDSPARSRRLTEAWVESHPRRSEVVLAVSEIVANAVTHGAPRTTKSGLTMILESNDERLRVVVQHPGSVFDPSVDGDFHGLGIVDGIVDRWGIDGSDDQVEVWFEMDHTLDQQEHAGSRRASFR